MRIIKRLRRKGKLVPLTKSKLLNWKKNLYLENKI